jgi:hypothetical protein
VPRVAAAYGLFDGIRDGGGGMTDHQNFKNGDNHFNIFLNENGDLEDYLKVLSLIAAPASCAIVIK